MRIFVCEDEPLYQTAITQAISRWKEATKHFDTQVTVFHSSEDLLEVYKSKESLDLLFIDIQIPGEINGLELARSIRETDSEVFIVFITNYSEYVYEGYTVNALRYLRKPVNDEEIYYCCSYVHNRLALQKANSLCLTNAGKKYVIRYMEIISFEVCSHDVYITTSTKAERIKISSRISDVYEMLPQQLFVFCHRSFIVNIAHIRMLRRTNLILSNGTSLPISRTYAESLNNAFDSYYHGGDHLSGLDSI